jgi:HlyD family secretion protein
MFRKKGFWISLFILLALGAGGGYAYYTYVYLPGQTVPEPTIATSQVVRGDLVISVSGSGTLVPASEIELGFQSGGYLDEVLVEVGDRVQAGDVLARLETDDLELALAKADINARLAQLDLADASEGPTETELEDAAESLENARVSLTVVQYAYNSAQNSNLDSAVRARQIEFQWAVDRYYELEENGAAQDKLNKAWEDWAQAEYRYNQALRQAQMEQLDVWNQVDQAQNRVYQSEEALELLQSGPTTDTIIRAELKVDQATLALEDARDNLEGAVLRAPFAGTVVAVSAIPGEQVGSAAFITLSDLEEPLLQFWVEEADLSGVAVGNSVEIFFEALPDDVFGGEVVQVDPALTTVGNTLAVQAWASVDISSQPAGLSLLGGMNADIDIISAEARDALLVPVQALRELGSDQYAVFVVQPDGEMMLRPIEVGLMDFVNAEVVSGLELDETVSLGIEESTETVVPEQEEMMPGGGIPGGGMFGGGGPPGP